MSLSTHADVVAPAAIILFALVLRLPFVTGLPDTPDAVRLIRAVGDFDVHAFSPQFPGYPLAVLLARAMPGDPGAAWARLSALAGAASVLASMVLFGRMAMGRGASLGAGLAVAVLPFAVRESWLIGTDTLALPFVLGAVAARVAGRPVLAGLVLGLGLGIRPSDFPWVAALLVTSGRRRAVIGLSLGLVLWLLPTLAGEGVAAYVADGLHFVRGHFLTWGGTALAGAPSWSTRWAQIGEAWIWRPLRLPLAPFGASLAVLLAVIAGAAAHVPPVRRPFVPLTHRPLLAGSVAYALWILVAQNPENVRHALPLAVVAVGLAGAGWVRWIEPAQVRARRRAALVGVAGVAVITAMSISSLLLGRAYRASIPPALGIARSLRTDPLFDPLLDRIYTGAERPYFTWIGPSWDVATATSYDEVADDLASLPFSPRRVWITGSVAGCPPDAVDRYAERSLEFDLWEPRVELFVLDGRSGGR